MNLIVILGPTASGKTKLAVKLAGKFNGEIISADSRQIYKNMDIGTGKDLNEYKIQIPSPNKLQATSYKLIPCHLINIKKPNQEFSLAEYQKLCFSAIDKIHKKNKIPLLVGGTGLYISAIVDNYQIPSIPPNKKLRAKLEQRSLKELLAELKKTNPIAWQKVDRKNKRRVIRAIEIALQPHRPSAKINHHQRNPKLLYNILQIGIKKSPISLISLINKRVDKMIKKGLIQETKKLLKKYGPNSIPLQTIGYAEIIDYLNKKTTLEQAVELIKIHTRQFTKRQLTWFKRDKRIKWINNYGEAEKLVQEFLT